MTECELCEQEMPGENAIRDATGVCQPCLKKMPLDIAGTPRGVPRPQLIMLLDAADSHVETLRDRGEDWEANRIEWLVNNVAEQAGLSLLSEQNGG